jgi:hypothetical protein
MLSSINQIMHTFNRPYVNVISSFLNSFWDSIVFIGNLLDLCYHRAYMASKCQESSKCSCWIHCKVKDEQFSRVNRFERRVYMVWLSLSYESGFSFLWIDIFSIIYGKYVIIMEIIWLGYCWPLVSWRSWGYKGNVQGWWILIMLYSLTWRVEELDRKIWFSPWRTPSTNVNRSCK